MQTECRQQSKTKRPKFIRKVTCQVCGDIANDHTHYGGVACYSCKGKQQQKHWSRMLAPLVLQLIQLQPSVVTKPSSCVSDLAWPGLVFN